MKTSTLKCIGVFSLLFIVAGLQAQNRYRVEDVPNVQLQDYTRYVSDPENALDMADVMWLDERLARLRDSLIVETAIVVLPAIDRQYGSAKEFATELFNSWGIGDRESHNGLLILLLTADGEREIVFETGYGTEKVLTDGFCKLIQVQKMVPFLKEGAYGEGLIVGVEEVEKIFNGTSEFQVKKPLLSNNEKLALIWLVGGLIIIFLVEWIRKKRIVASDDPFVNAAKYQSLSVSVALWPPSFPSYFLYMLYKAIAKRRICASIQKSVVPKAR